MAFEKRLAEVWYLSDHILDPFPIGDVKPVLRAVAEAGFVPDPAVGMNMMFTEWIYARSWEYTTRFDAPEEESEKVFLRFDRVWSRAQILVNGQSAGFCEPGEATVDITPFLKAGSNALAVQFAPMIRVIPGETSPNLGLEGSVTLAAGSRLDVIQLRSRARRGEICARPRLEVYAPGRYAFDYLASSEGEKAGSWRFEETLPAGVSELEHVLPIDPGDRNLDLRLDVIRDGVGCARLRFQSAAPNGKRPMRVLGVYAAALNGDLISALKGLGADGACLLKLPGRPFRRLDADCFDGLCLTESALPLSCPACEDLKKAAGDAPYWPPRTPLWRLRGGLTPDVEGIKALFGERAAMDGETFRRASQFRQADTVMRAALEGRRLDKCAAFFYNAPGDGLYTEGVAGRMAGEALRRAWRKSVAFAYDAPDCAAAGEALNLNICLSADGPGGENAILRVTAFDFGGSRLNRIRERVSLSPGAADIPFGFEMPREGGAILRTALIGEDGAEISRIDQIVPVRGDQAPWQAILRPARIAREAGAALNAGDTATLAPGFCLLPGETGESDREWVNEEIV